MDHRDSRCKDCDVATLVLTLRLNPLTRKQLNISASRRRARSNQSTDEEVRQESCQEGSSKNEHTSVVVLSKEARQESCQEGSSKNEHASV